MDGCCLLILLNVMNLLGPLNPLNLLNPLNPWLCQVPLGTPSLRAGAMHLGKYCEVQNNEFMLCRTETRDPR